MRNSPLCCQEEPPTVSAATVAGATVGSVGFLSLAVLGMALWLRRRSGRTVVDGDKEEKEKQKEIVGAV
jgi:hypothetical protein